MIFTKNHGSSNLFFSILMNKEVFWKGVEFKEFQVQHII